MSLATEPTRRLTQEQQQTYTTLVGTAVQLYTLNPSESTFIQHNAGIVYRITTQTQQQYLLKLHKRVGVGDDPSAEQLEPGLAWLTAFAQASDVVVQVPVRTKQDSFVGQIISSCVAEPINCTLQEWLEGDVPNGDFTQHHAHQLGALMAKLHNFSRAYPVIRGLSAMYHDAQALVDNIQLLRTMLNTTLLSPQDFEIVLVAGERIVENMTELGTSTDVWGPVHGDLHYDNLLFYDDEIRPIDFTGLRLAHYLYDIGVTLYHTFHQGIALREALFAGYQQVGKLPTAYQQYVEGFIAYAAIDNVAWNSTIPEQVESKLFQRNVQNLVKSYCMPVAQGEPFLFR